jgi:hypothetical protein
LILEVICGVRTKTGSKNIIVACDRARRASGKNHPKNPSNPSHGMAVGTRDDKKPEKGAVHTHVHLRGPLLQNTTKIHIYIYIVQPQKQSYRSSVLIRKHLRCTLPPQAEATALFLLLNPPRRACAAGRRAIVGGGAMCA